MFDAFAAFVHIGCMSERLITRTELHERYELTAQDKDIKLVNEWLKLAATIRDPFVAIRLLDINDIARLRSSLTVAGYEHRVTSVPARLNIYL